MTLDQLRCEIAPRQAMGKSAEKPLREDTLQALHEELQSFMANFEKHSQIPYNPCRVNLMGGYTVRLLPADWQQFRRERN
jgi:hypothetical protein